MKIPRIVAVFFGAAVIALGLAFTKALLISGINTLPSAKVLVFAASTFGLIAALLDWALFRDRRSFAPVAHGSSEGRRSRSRKANISTTIPDAGSQDPQNAIARELGPLAHSTLETPTAERSETELILERARLRPIVFREIYPPPAATGLSFYGGAPVGPADLAWPRVRNKPGETPLSFVMQWDCAELSSQDATGLLPKHGVLYLFCDLTWGDPFDFRFLHASGPMHGWQALPIPPDLPPLYGDNGRYQIPYCSPWIERGRQDVPRGLPKWPFMPLAFTYPVAPGEGDADCRFWNDGEATAAALLALQHPEEVPAPTQLENRQLPFRRPFPAFPHDNAAVRVLMAKLMDQLRRPNRRLMPELPEQERESRFQEWREQAIRFYAAAVEHQPAAKVQQSLSDEVWRWLEGLEPVLKPGWGSLVEECVNVSLGLESEAASAIPADLLVRCSTRHKLAFTYLHDEYPEWNKPDARAIWEASKTEGSLKQVRSIHAPCPNRMFGPPSFVQGDIEEYLGEWLLLLELSSHHAIGLEFGEGVLQFLVRPADLREYRFDKVMLVATAY